MLTGPAIPDNPTILDPLRASRYARSTLDAAVLEEGRPLIRGGNEDTILRAWPRGAFELVLSPEILAEIGRVL
jgi:hypothetical protein